MKEFLERQRYLYLPGSRSMVAEDGSHFRRPALLGEMRRYFASCASGSEEPSQRCSGSGTKQSTVWALTVPDTSPTNHPPGISARPQGTGPLTRLASQRAAIGLKTSMTLPSF